MKLVRSRLEPEGGEHWEIYFHDIWCYVHPALYQSREQGWKLHVSATRSSATVVLERSLAVLLRHRCAFKFATTLDHVRLLNSTYYPRGGAGKFLTAYPDDDEHFRLLAEGLDRATAGLPGPRILSDRPYRPGSLVHYRYGGFAGNMALTNDGEYVAMLRSPDGGLIEDRRDAWFSIPAGVPSPLADDPAPASPARKPQPRPVRLAERFLVRQAIRHANRGGVYRATDTQTDVDVVIKEARPHVESHVDGWEGRDALRHEAEVLDLLAPLGVAPGKIALFEQDGHVFLAEELIEGVGLRDWVVERSHDRVGLSWELATDVIRRLAGLLEAVHGTGLALRDLTPNNVLVAPDGGLRIIDLELAAALGSGGYHVGTLGYSAPERQVGAPVAVAVDLYSLGAIAFLLVTGVDPAFPEDLPPVRSSQQQLEGWLAVVAEHSESARPLTPLIVGLLHEAPERRWDLERVRAFLEGQERAGTAARRVDAVPTSDRSEADGPRLALRDQERLIEDGLGHLLVTMTPESRDRLWPSTTFGADTDPCNVQHGAAGVLAVLTQAADVYGDERMRDAVRTVSEWIERQLPAEPRLLPGLYFGRSGTAWALYEAGRTLGDGGLAGRALELAKRVPIVWGNPDVTHGAAGAGLAQLHLWQATGDAELGRRLQRCADGLIASADRQATGAVWPVSASFDSAFAGSARLGFAHGVAGIAWFLLATGLATDRDDCVELARAGAETLCAAAWRDGDSATWDEGPGNGAGRWVHWCHGSSGVGTFLIRLWRVTGESRYRELAEMAAVAVRRARWEDSPAVCHGLSGNAEFLLDMAAILDEPRYRAWAEELAAAVFARCAYRDGRIVACDESGIGVVADYGVGLAGVVAFLLRLRRDLPRLWMAEPRTVEAAPR